MKLDELAVELNKVGDQLGKALDELIKALENQGNTTPEVDEAVVRLQAAAQALDDLNPDA